MQSLLRRVRHTIRRHGLAGPDRRVVVALSGGSDSVALLYLLFDLRDAGELQLAGAAHFNHRLRGPASDADESFCRELAANLTLPFVTESADVAAAAEADRVSVERAGRRLRYEFFERAGETLSADCIATGHTRDDQAETFLLRLIRGSGPGGLSGIHPRAGRVVRPLLEVGRDELRAYLADRGATFREDATNADVDVPRNRVRHELLPFVQHRFLPGIVKVLAREAEIARADAEYLEEEAARVVDAVLSRPDPVGPVSRDRQNPRRNLGETSGDEGGRWRLDVKALQRLPLALARRVVRRGLQRVAGGRSIGAEAVEAIIELAGVPEVRTEARESSVAESGTAWSRTPSRGVHGTKKRESLDLPGVRVSRQGDHIVLSRRVGRGRAPVTGTFEYLVPLPGAVEVPEAGCRLAARLEPGTEGGGAPATRATVSLAGAGAHQGRGEPSDEVMVAADTLVLPLTVRAWRAGDVFRPLGLGGRKKLQDLFVDRKVPRERRTRVPLVVDALGRIVWVAGHAIGDEFRVNDAAKPVVFLTIWDSGFDRE